MDPLPFLDRPPIPCIDPLPLLELVVLTVHFDQNWLYLMCIFKKCTLSTTKMRLFKDMHTKYNQNLLYLVCILQKLVVLSVHFIMIVCIYYIFLGNAH